jgi:hypothetical protein
MKKLLATTIVLLCTSCAPSQHVSTEWNMTWNCDGNSACARDMGAWSGSGSFDSEALCLEWETGFLNSFGAPYDSVTACTGN